MLCIFLNVFSPLGSETVKAERSFRDSWWFITFCVSWKIFVETMALLSRKLHRILHLVLGITDLLTTICDSG